MSKVLRGYGLLSLRGLLLGVACIHTTAWCDCPNDPDPAIECRRVLTPCTDRGVPVPLLGSVPAGQEHCSGNNVTTAPFSFPSGQAFQLTYNSQMHSSQRGVREDEGFGAGWVGVPRIESGARGSLVLRSADGGYTDYAQSGGGTWRSANWMLGDLSEIKRKSSILVLERQDGSSMRFAQTVGAYRYVTEMIDSAGLKTTVMYNREGRLNRITFPAGTFIQFTCEEGGGRCTAIADNNGVKYTLNYKDGRLSGYRDPAGTSTSIAYTKATSAAETLIASMTDTLGGKAFYAYYGDGVLKAAGDGDLHTTFDYGLTEVTSTMSANERPKEFVRYAFERRGTTSWIKATYKGDGDRRSNPGVLTLAVVRLADGRVSSSTDPSGGTTRFLYSPGRDPCSPTVRQDSPVATCIVASDGQKTEFTYANTRHYMPSLVKRFSADGALISLTRFNWTGRPWQPSSIQVVADGTVTKSVQFSYQTTGDVSLPSEVTTTQQAAYTYDPSVGGRVASALTDTGDKMSLQYDALGRVVSYTQNGQVTRYSYQQAEDGATTVTEEGVNKKAVKRSDYHGLSQSDETTYSVQGVIPATSLRVASKAEAKPNSVATEASAVMKQGQGTYSFLSVNNSTSAPNGRTDNRTIENYGAY